MSKKTFFAACALLCAALIACGNGEPPVQDVTIAPVTTEVPSAGEVTDPVTEPAVEPAEYLVLNVGGDYPLLDEQVQCTFSTEAVNTVKKEIFGDKSYEDLSEQDFNQLKDIVTDIMCTIKKNTSAINFWGNISLQKQLRTYIINVLLRNPLFSSIPSVFSNRKNIAQKIMELAYCHYGRNES